MKNDKLNGKVAVVTGASKGIGAGIAKEFAAKGAAVIVNYASSKTDADKVVNEITKRGGKAVAVQGSVTKKDDVEKLFSAAEKAFGKLDILVNNAGVYEFVPLEDITEQHYLKAAFDAVPDAVLVISSTKTLLYANRAAEEVFGTLYFGMTFSSEPPARTAITCIPRQIPSVGRPIRSAASSRPNSQASRSRRTFVIG